MTGRSSIVGNEMDHAECEAFLTSRGHGVLSMGVEDRGYGIPISFGYDENDSRLILEFVSAPESKKQTFATNTDEVTVTVYDYESVDSWESVVVTGTIHPIDADEVSERFASLFFAQADDAAGERRWQEDEAVDREWYEIRVTNISGRLSEGIRPRNP